jgi:hypothetical protein
MQARTGYWLFIIWSKILVTAIYAMAAEVTSLMKEMVAISSEILYVYQRGFI